MPDQPHNVSRDIDAMVLTPSDKAVQRRAALTVCATMSHGGGTREQIREVLAALGLLAVL